MISEITDSFRKKNDPKILANNGNIFIHLLIYTENGRWGVRLGRVQGREN